jgi:hypothetical protein
MRVATPAVANAWRRLIDKLCVRVGSSAAKQPSAATLRDLGLDSSEWHSIQAEAAGLIPATRRRVVSGVAGEQRAVNAVDRN